MGVYGSGMGLLELLVKAHNARDWLLVLNRLLLCCGFVHVSLCCV